MDINEVELLVLKARDGDRQAMHTLYQHFNFALRKYAFSQTRNIAVSEDLTQNVWLNVAKRITWLKDVSLFRSWLYKALRWEISDWYRNVERENRFKSNIALNERLCESPQIGEPKLQPLLSQLGTNERETAELFYVNDLSINEISLVLAIAEGTVKSRLHRARTQLKQLITQKERE